MELAVFGYNSHNHIRGLSLYLIDIVFQLKERIERWQEGEKHQRIGDILVKNAPFLKMYTEYVKNFDNAMTAINTWYGKSSKFAAIVDEIQVGAFIFSSLACTVLIHCLIIIVSVDFLPLAFLKCDTESLKDFPGLVSLSLALLTSFTMQLGATLIDSIRKQELEQFHRFQADPVPTQPLPCYP